MMRTFPIHATGHASNHVLPLVPLNQIHMVFSLLRNGRKARLEGRMEKARAKENAGDLLLKRLLPHGVYDRLMSVWECSLENDPMKVPEWEIYWRILANLTEAKGLEAKLEQSQEILKGLQADWHGHLSEAGLLEGEEEATC